MNTISILLLGPEFSFVVGDGSSLDASYKNFSCTQREFQLFSGYCIFPVCIHGPLMNGKSSVTFQFGVVLVICFIQVLSGAVLATVTAENSQRAVQDENSAGKTKYSADGFYIHDILQ